MAKPAPPAWLEQREQELSVWESDLVQKQDELGDAIRRFREEMAASLTQLGARKREIHAAAEALRVREAALARAEEAVAVRETRLVDIATQLAAAVGSAEDGAEGLDYFANNREVMESGGRPATAAASPGQGRRSTGAAATTTSPNHVAPRQRHTDPTSTVAVAAAAPMSFAEEVEAIGEDPAFDVASLVVQGSVVLTAQGHILSPLESAAVLVKTGAFDASEIEALMRQGFSVTAILAERLGGVDERPATPNRPRTRAVGATTRGGSRQVAPQHDFDDDDAYEDDGAAAVQHHSAAVYGQHLTHAMERIGDEDDYDEDQGEFDYIEDEEEEEEEEEEHNISLN